MEQKYIDLYDTFTHGGMSRRDFLDRLTEMAGSAAAAAVLLPVLQNNYALAETVPGSPTSVVSPWTGMAILGGVGGFLSLARGLQLGEPVAVIVAFSASATLAAITGGVIVFGDPLGSDALDVVARCLAFVAVIGAAALLPLVPERAREGTPAPQPAA